MNEKDVITPQEGSQCRHCLLYDAEFPSTCPAFFPKNIPQNILRGESTHESVVEGQNDEYIFIPDDEYKYPSL